MNALTKSEQTSITRMSESELIDILRNSFYPDASDGSIKMVIAYCKADQLDPMLKPVHIVPMSVKNKQTGNYEMRDQIMPGIGLYRIKASRTERFAGQTEPEFGPMVKEKLGGVELTYPEWCKVSVKKLMPNGSVATFTAVEYWIENYATAGRDTQKPNYMWLRRPRGQLAKCAEAQALRKAFPDLGSQPTAEEMEGKVIEDTAELQSTGGKPDVEMPQPKQTASQQADEDGVIDVEAKEPAKDQPEQATSDAKPAGDAYGAQLASEGEKAHILQKVNRKKITVALAFGAAGLPIREKLDGLTTDEFIALKDVLK